MLPTCHQFVIVSHAQLRWRTCTHPLRVTQCHASCKKHIQGKQSHTATTTRDPILIVRRTDREDHTPSGLHGQLAASLTIACDISFSRLLVITSLICVQIALQRHDYLILDHSNLRHDPGTGLTRLGGWLCGLQTSPWLHYRPQSTILYSEQMSKHAL